MNETDKIFANTDSGKLNNSVDFADNLKNQMNVNLNRIDLLTDAKIGDIKGLMKSMSD